MGEKIVKATYLNNVHPIIEELDVVNYLNDEETDRLKLINSALSQNWG